MKRLPLFLLFFISVTSGIKAQIGWQWGQYMVPRLEGGPASASEGWPIAVDKLGNTYTTGFTAADTCVFGTIVDLCPGRTNQFYIAKTNSSGNFLWVIHPAATPLQENAVVCLTTDSSNNLYALCIYQAATFTLGTASVTNPVFAGYPVYVLVKIAPSGTALWARNVAPVCGCWLYTGTVAIGDAQNAYIFGISSADSVIIGSDTLRNHSGAINAFVAKYDPSGSALWGRILGSRSNVTITDMAVTKTGKVYLTGSFADTLKSGAWILRDTATPLAMPFLVRMDRNGNTVWAEKNANTKMHYVGVITDTDEYVYITGDFLGNASIGSFAFTPPDSVSAVLIAMADSSGTFVWAKAGYGRSAGGMDIAVDLCGNLIVTGKMDALKPLWFGTDTLHSPAGSNAATFAAIFDLTGNYKHSVTLPDGGDDWFWVAPDYFGNLIVSGDYIAPFTLGTTHFPPAVPTGGLECPFFAKYTYDTVLCQPEIIKGTVLETKSAMLPVLAIRLFPDPASSDFYIESDLPLADDATAVLYDITGKSKGAYRLSGTTTEISIRGFAPGIYLCRIVSGGRTITVRKLAVQ